MMTIQINTDHNIETSEKFETQLRDMLADKLGRFSGHLTRLEMHLSDENSGEKSGKNDKKCLIEARWEGMAPIVVSENSDNVMQSVNGATAKMKAALTSAIEKARNY